MTTMATPNHRLSWFRRILIGSTTAIIAILITSIVFIVTAQVGLGDMISEKMLGRDGVADASLLLGRTGTSTELSVLGFAPAITTSPITVYSVVGVTLTATLAGNVSDMNGMPTATGYFVWGLAPGALVNTTATFPIAGAGDYTANVAGLDVDHTLYYQFVTDADGTSYGAVSSFLASSSPTSAGNALIKGLLRLAVAAGILIAVIRNSTRKPVRTLVLVGIGIIGFIIISQIIDSLL